MPPVAFDTGKSTRFRRLVFGFDRISTNPSSTSDVRVRPSSAAFFFSLLQQSVVYSDCGSHASIHNTDASVGQTANFDGKMGHLRLIRLNTLLIGYPGKVWVDT
jgi:hypothetical protein